MTVKELIAILQKHDPDLPVFVDNSGFGLEDYRESNVEVVKYKADGSELINNGAEAKTGVVIYRRSGVSVQTTLHQKNFQLSLHKDCRPGEGVLGWISKKEDFDGLDSKTKRLGDQEVMDGKARYPIFIAKEEFAGFFLKDVNKYVNWRIV